MLPGIGWSELLVIAALAIIVVGPKELPFLMRKLGRFMGRARALAREFQDSFEDIAREAELEELRKKAADSAREIEAAVGPMSPEDEAALIAAHNEKVLAAERAAMDEGGGLSSEQQPLDPGGAAGETPPRPKEAAGL